MVATLKTVTGTIPAGQTMSSDVDCRGANRILRVLMPAAWTRAPLSFRLSSDQVDWGDLYHTTVENFGPFEVFVPEVIPGSVVTLPPNMSSTVAFVRVRSGGRNSQVPQAADRVFKFILEMPEVPPAGPTGDQGPIGPTGATGPMPVIPAATGPTGGFLQSGNIITQWGSFASSTSGVTVNFPKPYIDGPPSVTASAASGGVLQVSATKTSVTISCNSGTPIVSWKAIGS